MSESKWGKVRDSTVPVLLGTLIVAMFYTTTSIHDRMGDMESRLGDQMHRMETDLSNRINGVEKSLSARINGVEKRLSARINGVERELSDRITRLETLMEVHLDAHSGQAGPRGGQ